MASLRYTSISDLVNEIPDNIQALLTDDGTTLSKDSDILTSKLLAAESQFESMIANIYTIPVQAEDGTIPEIVKESIYVIAKYKLYGRRDAISREIQEQYNAVMSWLKQVSKGDAAIPILDSTDDVEDTGVRPAKITIADECSSEFNNFV